MAGHSLCGADRKQQSSAPWEAEAIASVGAKCQKMDKANAEDSQGRGWKVAVQSSASKYSAALARAAKYSLHVRLCKRKSLDQRMLLAVELRERCGIVPPTAHRAYAQTLIHGRLQC